MFHIITGPRPRDPARGRGQAGLQTRAPSSPVCGPASIFRFYCRPPLSLLFFRCTLIAVLIDNAADALRKAQAIRGLILQLFRGRL